MQTNHMRKKLEAGGVVTGVAARLPHPATIEAMGYAGLDWVLIDCEHGSIGFETAETMCMYAYAVGITPIIRISTLEESLIMRALDIGAMGVLVPMVRTVADAQLVVKASRYYPMGSRGSGPTRGVRFGAMPADEYYKWSNRETVVMLNIETAEAVANIEEISKVEGIDILSVGPADLSQSLGVPGELTHPKMTEAIERVLAAGKRNKKWVGIGTRFSSATDIAKLKEYGYVSIMAGIDLYYLRSAFSALRARE